VWLRRADGSPAAAISCDGNDALWAAQSDFGVVTVGRTIVACVRVANATPQGFLFDSSSYVTGLTRAQVNNGRWQVSVYGAGSSGAAGAAGTGTATVATNVWQIHTFRVATDTGAMTSRHFIDGVEAGTVSNSVPGALGGLIVGANASAVLGFRGDIAEFLVFNTALDDANRTGIETHLSAKWAGVGPDPDAPAPPVPPRFVPSQPQAPHQL
jgi:hypothetical protein